MTRIIPSFLALCLSSVPAFATNDTAPPIAPATAKASSVAASSARAAGGTGYGGSATGGSAVAQGGNSSNGGVTVNAAPGFGLPSFGGGICAVVGIGVAVGVSAGGGALGPAWESTNCHRREMAKILMAMGKAKEAEALLLQDPDVADAYKAAQSNVTPVAASSPPQQVASMPRPSWCNTRGARGEVHPDCR